MQVGQLVSGKVIGVQPYGAFVRLNVPDTKRAPTGLLHISQISAKRVEDMESVFKVGAKVKCMVIESDPEKNRISLSTRPLESTPGEMLRDQAAVYANAEEAAVAYQVGKMRVICVGGLGACARVCACVCSRVGSRGGAGACRAARRRACRAVCPATRVPQLATAGC